MFQLTVTFKVTVNFGTGKNSGFSKARSSLIKTRVKSGNLILSNRNNGNEIF